MPLLGMSVFNKVDFTQMCPGGKEKNSSNTFQCSEILTGGLIMIRLLLGIVVTALFSQSVAVSANIPWCDTSHLRVYYHLF